MDVCEFIPNDCMPMFVIMRTTIMVLKRAGTQIRAGFEKGSGVNNDECLF